MIKPWISVSILWRQTIYDLCHEQFQFTFAGTLLSKSGGWILFPGLRIMLRSGIQVGSKAKLNRNHNQQGHNL